MNPANLNSLLRTGILKIDTFVIGIAIITVILCGTYIFTSCRFYIDSFLQRNGIMKEPLTLPYWLPYLGNALSMTRDSRVFYNSAM
jgi:hypothetical protein